MSLGEGPSPLPYSEQSQVRISIFKYATTHSRVLYSRLMQWYDMV